MDTLRSESGLSRPVRPRVLLADDHRMVAEALSNLLSADYDLIGIVEDGRELVETAMRKRPDVIVADITMPNLNGLDALVQLKKDNPSVRVVFLTMHREVAYARRALETGAAGFVLKHSAPAELVAAIEAALAGRIYITSEIAGDVFQQMQRDPGSRADPVASLSPRQRQVLQHFAEGNSAKEVAGLLGISVRTVEFHKYQMMEHLGMHSSTELTHFAIKHGIVSV